MKTGTFARAGLLVALASEFGFEISVKPVPGGVEVSATPHSWAVIRAELAREVADTAARPEHRAYAQELYDGIIAARLDVQ